MQQPIQPSENRIELEHCEWSDKTDSLQDF
jgi:hypothetical protein